jgi:hypothetical protein
VKKNSTVKGHRKKGATKTTKDIQESITIGVDLAVCGKSKNPEYCSLAVDVVGQLFGRYGVIFCSLRGPLASPESPCRSSGDTTPQRYAA